MLLLVASLLTVLTVAGRVGRDLRGTAHIVVAPA